MKTIWKYAIPREQEFHVAMPTGAKIIAVQMQKNQIGVGMPYMWAEVDSEAPTEKRDFFIVGTGGVVPSGDDIYVWHIDTFQTGEFVWHLYGKIARESTFK